MDIARLRLLNQHLTRPVSHSPADVVAWLCAVQAQDYTGAKWALGLRCRGATDEVVERAFSDGAILRTHALRPTWHFVTPADIRWLLALTGPRIEAVSARRYRELGLDQAVFARSNGVLARALEGGKQLTREEARSALRQAGVAVDDGARLAYLLSRAELDGIMCSGPRRGKQFTYALLDERVSSTKTLGRDAGLAELARRYFASRGPATLQDFAWWSGLAAADARAGVEMVESSLRRETADGRTYFFVGDQKPGDDASPAAYLLPTYDEFLIGYTDRRASIGTGDAAKIAHGPTYHPTVVVDGRVVGTWKRSANRGAVVVDADFFVPPTEAERQAVTAAAQRYGAFLGMPAVLA